MFKKNKHVVRYNVDYRGIKKMLFYCSENNCTLLRIEMAWLVAQLFVQMYTVTKLPHSLVSIHDATGRPKDGAIVLYYNKNEVTACRSARKIPAVARAPT